MRRAAVECWWVLPLALGACQVPRDPGERKRSFLESRAAASASEAAELEAEIETSRARIAVMSNDLEQALEKEQRVAAELGRTVDALTVLEMHATEAEEKLKAARDHIEDLRRQAQELRYEEVRLATELLQLEASRGK